MNEAASRRDDQRRPNARPARSRPRWHDNAVHRSDTTSLLATGRTTRPIGWPFVLTAARELEVHLQIKESKRRVWPQYVASAYGGHGCPSELVVVTPDAAVERWARQPIRIGHRSVVVPHVLGPSRIPLLGVRRIARAPVLAMLSTLAHMDDSRCALQALRTLDALGSWEGDADGRLADILLAALSDAVRKRMEEMMRTGKYEDHSDIARKSFARGLEEGEHKGREEGRAAGQARALLLVLRSRGIAIHDAAMRRIEREQDEARLDAWTRRAVTAPTIDDVFADD